MRLLIVNRSRTAEGRVIEARRETSAPTVRVGRRASCEVLLADPQVALDQGVIIDRQGLVYTEEGRLGSGTGQPATPRTVHLGSGESVDVGPFRLTASAGEEGFDATLTVERIHAVAADAGSLRERARHLSLGTVGLSRRSLAWALLLVSIAVFLVWPAGKVFDLPWSGLPAPSWASDRVWNPGPLMLAHQPLEGKCEACHQVAFQHTPDTACLECHQSVGHHVAQSLQPAALFEGMRCAECHRDHKGLKAGHRDDDRLCVDCHQDIQKRSPGVASKNVADFARDHPPFRLTLPADKGEAVKRVRMEKAPITHRSGLVFPHDVHLDRAGVKHPDKGTIRLDCDACHRPDTSKRSFEPVAMGRHCQECHKLEFEPAVTNRQVPHASPAEAMTVVREFYANLALNGVPDSFQKAFGVPGEGLLRRVGDPSPVQRQNALAIAQRKADQVGEELFEIRSCKTCHELIRKDTPQGREWTVTRVLNGHTWMPHARFDHKAHAQSKCSDCHDVAKSKRAEDLAMPAIETCRECHAGAKPVLDRLTSNCLLCHGFHEHANPWDPAFKPRNPSPRMAGAARAP